MTRERVNIGIDKEGKALLSRLRDELGKRNKADPRSWSYRALVYNLAYNALRGMGLSDEDLGL